MKSVFTTREKVQLVQKDAERQLSTHGMQVGVTCCCNAKGVQGSAYLKSSRVEWGLQDTVK